MWKDLQADSDSYCRANIEENNFVDYREKDFFGGARAVNVMPLSATNEEGKREGRTLEP